MTELEGIHRRHHRPHCVLTRGPQGELNKPPNVLDLITGPASLAVHTALSLTAEVREKAEDAGRRVFYAGQIALMGMFPK